MVTIDGSIGEGGGQVLRSALTLSMITCRTCRIVNIRAARRPPGLRKQHLMAVKAASTIARATVSGAHVGSAELIFEPRAVLEGDYQFDIGTAGSTTLVLQTVLPAVMGAPGPSVVSVTGGTHNPFAPPFDFLDRAFLPLLRRLGVAAHARLRRHGFYPAGGGHVELQLTPAAHAAPLDLRERGQIVARRGTVLLSRLPRHIADRETGVLRDRLGWPADAFDVVEVADAAGPGNAVLTTVESEHLTEVFASVGTRGVRAEAVAARVAEETQQYLEAAVPVGEHLADQLLLPLALLRGGRFRTTTPTSHTLTNIDVIGRFMEGVVITVAQVSELVWEIEVRVG